MIEHSPHGNISADARHLWNSNRPLAVTILVGLGVVIWYLYQKSQGGGIAAPINATLSASGLPASIQNTYITDNKTITAGSPEPIAPVVGAPFTGYNWGYQQGIGTSNGPVSGPTATGQPIIGNPIPQPGRITPIIPYNSLPVGTRYSTVQDLQAQPNLTWMGVTYKKVPGSNGLLWGQPVYGGPQVLLYGPPSAY